MEGQLRQIKETHTARLKPVILKSSPAQRLASFRQILPSIKNLGVWQEDRLAAIDRRLKEASLRSKETSILIFHQDEYRDEKVNVEIGRFLEVKNNMLISKI